jgi:hypothetical protein
MGLHHSSFAIGRLNRDALLGGRFVIAYRRDEANLSGLTVAAVDVGSSLSALSAQRRLI